MTSGSDPNTHLGASCRMTLHALVDDGLEFLEGNRGLLYPGLH